MVASADLGSIWMRPALAMLVLIVLIAVGIPLVATMSGPSGVLPDPQIAAATFRYQFQHNASGLRASAAAYCIGYGAFGPDADSNKNRTDPPQEVLIALADVVPAVKPYSQCSHTKEQGVRDKASGKRALIFTLRSMECSEPLKCRVDGGYYEGGESASGNSYFLERRDGKWLVIGDKMHWIS